MNKWYFSISATVILFCRFNHPLNAQLRGSDLMEYQLGNLPELEPKDQSSLYNQLDLSYRYKSLSIGTRLEQYYPSFGDSLKVYPA
ncbi:MAG: hypothetical protein HC906_03760 [Bacteroidales bacterium]|nr:hypothetical protein [Bacteroidales bacterium]